MRRYSSILHPAIDDGFVKNPSAPFGAGLRFNIPEIEVAFSKKTSIIRHRHKIV
jgi:hypothetical protein